MSPASRIARLAGLVLAATSYPLLASAQTTDASAGDLQNEIFDTIPNVPAPTMGGKQFWEDHLHFREWRIQRNVVTGHFRLVDPGDFRQAFGSYERCAARLEEIKQERGLEPYSGKAVILMHGLGRSRTSMAGFGAYLEKHGGYHVCNITYPTTRGDVASHAECLGRVIDHLEGVEEISFVGHSLGNLVVRYYLGELQRQKKTLPPQHRLHRIVMLTPPNGGAVLAERFGRNKMFELIAGASGRQIASNWEELEARLATPSCEFGIIAGGGGPTSDRNPLVPGDDDLVVSVEETRLPGAHDFVVLPVVHTYLMDDEGVQERTLNFLKHGYFVSEYERQPIPR